MTATWADEWRDARNLLCIRLDSMGDVLMTDPAMRALKEGHLDRRLTLLTSPSGAEAAALLDEVDDVLIYQAPWMKTPTDGPETDLRFIESLRSRRFDAAAVFTVYSQNPLPAALVTYLAGIPRRAAYCRENPYHLLTHWLREQEPDMLQRHEVRRQLDLAAALGCATEDERIRLSLTTEHQREAEAALASAAIDPERPWMLVHPGASAPSRRYRLDGYAQAIRALRDVAGIQVLLSGSEPEGEILRQLQAAAGLPQSAIVPELSLGGLAALISRAALLLSNNTGPVHLAAATGTPVVDLYALTNPQHTPWQVPARVLNRDVECRWCYSSVCRRTDHACLDSIEPSEVARAALDLLASSSRGRGMAEG